jgi:hypothetical protein
MAKELTIQKGEAPFETDLHTFSEDGKHTAERALESMGGYPGLVANLPFDRGDARHALVSLCLKLAAAIEVTDTGLAGTLRAEALKRGDTEKEPGSKREPLHIDDLLATLRAVWKDLDETHKNQIRASPGMTGDLGAMLDVVRVLLVFSDPEGTPDGLKLQKEQRAIKEALRLAPHRDKIRVEELPAATAIDLRRELLQKEEYDIIHFSGHSNDTVLVFATESNETADVPLTAIAGFVNQYPSIK